MSAQDLTKIYQSRIECARWAAERENATARLSLARAREARAILLSQHEPVNSLGIDREKLRLLLDYTAHHEFARLERECRELGGQTDER